MESDVDAERIPPRAELRLRGLGLPRIESVPAPFMRAVELPPGDADQLWGTLYEDFCVEVPV